jgi:hypothetical protein
LGEYRTRSIHCSRQIASISTPRSLASQVGLTEARIRLRFCRKDDIDGGDLCDRGIGLQPLGSRQGRSTRGSDRSFMG